MNTLLTIFTPTYNRAYILPQLYESLVRQTSMDFEWLIVDDGSSDNTAYLVEDWIRQEKIRIRYIWQENGGKMKAHNTGVQNTMTELFFCVDSDDHLTNTAVEIIINKWSSLSDEEKCYLAGMIGYKGETSEKLLGNSFPQGVSNESLSGFYEKGLTGDTSLIFKTEIIKRFPFPIIGKEKFITEAYVYDQIDRQYKLYAIPQVLTICEYRADGITQNLLKVIFNNPCGYVAYNMQRGNFAKNSKECFLAYIRASAFDKYSKKIEMPVLPTRKVLYVLSRPLGKVFFLYKKRCLSRQQGKE